MIEGVWVDLNTLRFYLGENILAKTETLMNLPPQVIEAINQNAQREGLQQPEPEDDLFRSGILDSFSLVDFVAVLETACSIKVPDSDILPDNFKNLRTIENYVATRKVEAQ